MEFEKMKITELKKECKLRKLKVSGNKIDLIQRLNSYETDKKEYNSLASIKTKTVIIKNKTQDIEADTNDVFKMLELLDKIQGDKKLYKDHPISVMRMKCYKQLLSIISKVLVLTDNKKNDVHYKEKMSLIQELRKYAESNRMKILDPSSPIGSASD
jgi:transcriptional regulator with PAS, ATPase and Fis domain